MCNGMMGQVRSALMRGALLACVSTSIAAQAAEPAASVERLLDALPGSLDTHGSIHEGYQYIGDVPTNLERMYGVECVLEYPFPKRNPDLPSPSKEADYVPLAATETTTLREFLEQACSDNKLEWGILHGALHLWPATRGDEVTYLDSVTVSLDLQGASLLEAAKAWALAVNKNRPVGAYGLRVSHPYVSTATFHYRATPGSITRKGAVTLKLDGVTAREALCAIQAVSTEWVRVTYRHSEKLPGPRCVFLPSEAELKATPKITEEERNALNAEEGLDSVLVE